MIEQRFYWSLICMGFLLLLVLAQLYQLNQKLYSKNVISSTTAADPAGAQHLSSAGSDPETFRFFKFREAIYQERRLLLRQYCSENITKTGKKLEHVYDKDMMLMTEHSLAYCPNAKTGTTTWMGHFANVADVPDRALFKWKKKFQLHGRMKAWYRFPSFSTDTQGLIFRHFLSFTFVRHPFVRLASTYQDKVIDHHHQSWSSIIPKNFTAEPKDARKYPNKPTFREFVDFHLKGGTAGDVHVRTFIKKCEMCNLHYDVIGKLETAPEDIRYILLKSGLYNEVTTNERHVSSGGSTEDLAKEYFASITKEQFIGLSAYYKHDFNAFAYDPEEFNPDLLSKTQTK